MRGFVADFYCHSLGLVIEVDGKVHAGQRGYDACRDAWLCEQGCCVLRFSNEDVIERLDDVMSVIQRFVDSAKTFIK